MCFQHRRVWDLRWEENVHVLTRKCLKIKSLVHIGSNNISSKVWSAKGYLQDFSCGAEYQWHHVTVEFCAHLLPLQHQNFCRRLGLVKKHGTERAGVINFFGPETLEIFWWSVPLSQISKTEFTGVLCSCCSHISAFYVPCHVCCDMKLMWVLLGPFVTKNSQCTHSQPLTAVICVTATYCNGLWLWGTLYEVCELQIQIFKGAYW